MADQAALATARKAGDSAAVRTNREKIKQLNDAITKYREDLGRKYPTPCWRRFSRR